MNVFQEIEKTLSRIMGQVLTWDSQFARVVNKMRDAI